MQAPDHPQNLDTQPASPPAAAAENRSADDGPAVTTAATVVALWRQVDAALRPIIGQRGMVALFNRSVQLSAEAHPWLLGLRQDPATELQFSVLAHHLSRQQAEAAVAGADALLLAFHRLLGSLIGASLTERLLRPALGPTLDASPTRDASP